MIAYLDTLDPTVIKFVQLATTANTALKCVLTVPTTPHAITGMVTVNVCPAGRPLTAPYPVVQVASVHSALRPAPVRPTSAVTALLETVCVKERTVKKTPLSSQGASWSPFLLVRGSRGEPSAASSCSSSWWSYCWLCCCFTAAGRRTNRTTRRPCPSPPEAQSTLNTPFQMFLTVTTTTTPTPAITH